MTNMQNMTFPQLEKNLFVSPQITVEQIDTIVTSAIKTVICHRPDEEIASEFNHITPHHDSLEDTLQQQDIQLIYQPIYNISMPEVSALATILKEGQQPVLMYCASGTRSVILWALSQTLIEKRSKQEITGLAEKAGYHIAQYLP